MSKFAVCPTEYSLGTFIDIEQVESIVIYMATNDDDTARNGYRVAYITMKSGDQKRLVAKKREIYAFANRVLGTEHYKLTDGNQTAEVK